MKKLILSAILLFTIACQSPYDKNKLSFEALSEEIERGQLNNAAEFIRIFKIANDGKELSDDKFIAFYDNYVQTVEDSISKLKSISNLEGKHDKVIKLRELILKVK